MMHIYISNLATIGSDNGLLPGGRQAIIWTNTAVLLIGHLGTNFNAILIRMHMFAFKKMHLKMTSAKWWPSCHCLNVLRSMSVSLILWTGRPLIRNLVAQGISNSYILWIFNPSGAKIWMILGWLDQYHYCWCPGSLVSPGHQTNTSLFFYKEIFRRPESPQCWEIIENIDGY